MNSELIQYLIDHLQESTDVEAKNWLGGLANNEEKAKLAKELIALANNGGGHIFIGFDDATNLSEIVPSAGELEAFTADAIAGIIQKYAEPPFACRIGYFKQRGSEVSHPVIEVSGNHRTPIFAKSGSPDAQNLKNGIVYLRRPGGYSEPARNQDDWEKLIDRLVKARQAEQLDAIRQIMIPTEEKKPPIPSLVQWTEESYQVWLELTRALPPNSPHRLGMGHWAFSFEIADFAPPSLSALNEALDRAMPAYSGWPPFTYLHHAPKKPNALGSIIQAWLVDPADENAKHSDFWRLSRDGKGYLLRPMQEDEDGYAGSRFPTPNSPLFDWVLPIWRTTELLKFVEALALTFSNENAEFGVILKYYGMKGRTLFHRNWKYSLREGARCAAPVIESKLSGQVHAIRTNLEELIFSLLAPVFEQFEFQSLPRLLVANIVKEVLGTRNR